MTSTGMSADVAAAAAAITDKDPPPDRLKYLRAKIAEARDLELKINELQNEVTNLSKKLWATRSDELPGLFQELGVTTITLDASGNMPGYVAKLVTQFSANLPKDEREEQAFKKFGWLRELAKNTYTIFLDKGDAKRARALEKVLKTAKLPFESKVSVHASTLTAEIRRRFESGQPLPPADLDLLGAFVRPIVKLDKVKEKM